MKLIKFGFIVAVAVMAIIGVSTTSYAFHSGGVAGCESCHTMHNSLTTGSMTGNKSTTPGAPGTGNPAASAVYLLRGSDQSSTCLNCHEATDQSSYHVSAPDATLTASANTPINYGPGGDFSWLKSATTTTVVPTSTLNRRGHNIVAADFGYIADTENTTAPGGSGFTAANLNCISCHNPHNQLRRTSDTSNTYVKPAAGTNVYGIAGSGSSSNAPVATATAPLGPFRFLRGAGADQAPLSTGYAFAANPPAVMSPNTYNRSEETAQTHVAYGSGMSDWCGNCHSGMNIQTGTFGSGGHPHPVNKALGATYAANYNAYKGSGDLTGSNGYNSLVPVEMDTEDYSLLKAAASSANGGNYLAATATSKVMCLSCHRAHASGFQSMTRFNVAGNTTAANGTDYVMATGMTNTTQALAAYYKQPATQFSANTKTLCNKCHVKD